jgi:hypothetical protein
MSKLLSSPSNRFVPRGLRTLVFAGSWLIASGLGRNVARAETAPTRECIEAHANGQVARGQGGLLQARSYFHSCAAESCPQIIRDDCAKFGAEIEALLPTVVVVARSTSGQDLAGGTVKIDGSAQGLPVDGRAIFVDPGSHVFKVITRDGAEASVTTSIGASEKNRPVVVVPPPRESAASDAPGPAEGRKISPLVYVFGSLGVAAAGSFTYFALDGHSREKTLEECKPGCDPSDVSKMHRSYLVADVSLGVAVASLGLGAYFLLRPPSAAPPAAFAMSSLSLSTSPDLTGLRVSAAATF